MYTFLCPSSALSTVLFLLLVQSYIHTHNSSHIVAIKPMYFQHLMLLDMVWTVLKILVKAWRSVL